jgi:hypothetical protein
VAAHGAAFEMCFTDGEEVRQRELLGWRPFLLVDKIIAKRGSTA